jgi:hypothetical protein
VPLLDALQNLRHAIFKCGRCSRPQFLLSPRSPAHNPGHETEAGKLFLYQNGWEGRAANHSSESVSRGVLSFCTDGGANQRRRELGLLVGTRCL